MKKFGNGPLVLAILDGMADNPNPEANAIDLANTPVIDGLIASAAVTHLTTHGKRVGLPEGQMGNSEVGHLNIGAGRVVMQDLTRIDDAVEEDAFDKLPELRRVFDRQNKGHETALHLIGLVSTGGVHSSMDHLLALVRAASRASVRNLFIHLISDGRDRPPTAAAGEAEVLENLLDEIRSNRFTETYQIASVIGRYHAMDRDKRWDRTIKAYNLFTDRIGITADDPIQALLDGAKKSGSDEFIEPCAISALQDKRSLAIEDGDDIVFFNFRADRMRQIVTSFFADDFTGFERAKRPKLAGITTLTEYDATYPVDVIFKPIDIKNHLGEVLADNDLHQVRIAETEKYPHVTYFFNGGIEAPYKNEQRIMVNSPRDVATYDLKPEMSAFEVKTKLIEALKSGDTDVAIVNFANCDMVGHTGVIEAAIKAVETVDTCIGEIIRCVKELDGVILVTADHGNADQMIDYQTHEPHTFHTTYPVWFMVAGGESLQPLNLRDGGALCDIAPTILDLLGVEQPAEMTGVSLMIPQSDEA
ncbi:MAG: 2,3-bisphosphoglycerate-independent phosphoglycerate mutase [bacterium]|nr:2,3-bisphosphoglycerate-independent phosphoglycerate mutase [bacterium]